MNDRFELRRGDAHDVPVIRELSRAAYAKWVPVIGREPKPMTADYDEALRKHRFDLLYIEGSLAGLIETDHQADRLLVVNVAISPEFQGMGFGSKLMRHAEELAHSLGCMRIWLYTGQLMVENVRLYRRLGYTVDREEEIGIGIIRLYMSKPLTRGAP